MSKWLNRLNDINSSKKTEKPRSKNTQNSQNYKNRGFGGFGSNESRQNENISGEAKSFEGFGSSESSQNENISNKHKKKYPKHIFNMWQPVNHLKILVGDKSYILGFIAGKQLDNRGTQVMLEEYARRWEKVASRQKQEHWRDNAGRKAANRWLLDGGK